MNKFFCALCNKKIDREQADCKFVNAKLVLCPECYKALNFVNVYRDNSETKIAQRGQ